MQAVSSDAPAGHESVLVDLALQGGGSHGAFTWGVLDRLLEETWLRIDGISGTSAGAMNAVVLVETGLAARELLLACQRIETGQGRERLVRWGPRTLDLDVIRYADLLSDEGLRPVVYGMLPPLQADYTLPRNNQAKARGLRLYERFVDERAVPRAYAGQAHAQAP